MYLKTIGYCRWKIPYSFKKPIDTLRNSPKNPDCVCSMYLIYLACPYTGNYFKPFAFKGSSIMISRWTVKCWGTFKNKFAPKTVLEADQVMCETAGTSKLPLPSPLFHFLALVSFLARSKPKVLFFSISLLRNQTETLATQASLSATIFVSLFARRTKSNQSGWGELSVNYSVVVG